MAVARMHARGRTAVCTRVPAAGFTLAEVLLASTMLAFGLLALQALGMAAVQATAAASRNSWAVATAVHRMEEAYDDLARGGLPPSLACTLPDGARVFRTVTVPEPPGRLARIEVEVVPASRGPAAVPFALRAHVYSPSGFGPSPTPAPCP